jgi:hypothetical protein
MSFQMNRRQRAWGGFSVAAMNSAITMYEDSDDFPAS